MKVWLIHLGELLPIDGKVRLFRYGILAEMLAERGHSVTRWAPTFIHATKNQRFTHGQTVDVNEKYRIELLYAQGYRRHVSLARSLSCLPAGQTRCQFRISSCAVCPPPKCAWHPLSMALRKGYPS